MGPAAALRELSARVLAAENPAAVVDALVASVREALAVDQVHVSEVSQDAAVSHSTAVAFDDGSASRDEYVQVIDERPSGVAHVVATGRALSVPDAVGSPILRPDYVRRFGAASVYFLPLSWAGEVRYVMILITRVRRVLDDEEQAIAETLANIAAAVLALKESEHRRDTRAERDAALARAARALNETLELSTVLHTLAREADLAVGGDLAGVYVGDARRGGVATAGHNTPPDWEGYVMKAGEGVAGQVLATGRPAISNAYQSDVRLPDQPFLQRLQTAVSVPMHWGGELRGALSVGFSRMRRITQDDLRTLEAIADLAAVACRNAESFEQAGSHRRVDALTGLADASEVLARAREEIARVRREGGDLALLVADVDGFKAINAAAGHQTGDEVLRRVARVLQEDSRPYDTVGRHGEDRFIVVLRSCDHDAALELAERLQERLASGIEVPEGTGPLSVSVGLAVWSEPQDAADLLDGALRAVRDGKRFGRGRVTPAP